MAYIFLMVLYTLMFGPGTVRAEGPASESSGSGSTGPGEELPPAIKAPDPNRQRTLTPEQARAAKIPQAPVAPMGPPLRQPGSAPARAGSDTPDPAAPGQGLRRHADRFSEKESGIGKIGSPSAAPPPKVIDEDNQPAFPIDFLPREALTQEELAKNGEAYRISGILEGKVCDGKQIRIDVMGTPDVKSAPRLLTALIRKGIGPFELFVPRTDFPLALKANCDIDDDGFLSTDKDFVAPYEDNPLSLDGDVSDLEYELKAGLLGMDPSASMPGLRRWLRRLNARLTTPFEPLIDSRTFYPKLIYFAPFLLLLGWLTPKTRADEQWRSNIDLPLALLAGIVMTGLCAYWFAPLYLHSGQLSSSDFPEHCDAIGALRLGRLDAFTPNRSIFAAYYPMILSRRLGILDGLTAAAMASTAVIGAALYLWGRALHGRFAGFAAVLAFGIFSPLAILPRTISFYPENVAAFVVSSAGAALALRYRSLPALLFAALGAGLAGLIDVRGILWVLPNAGLTLLAVFLAPWRRIPLRLLLVLAALAGCWHAGQWAYTADTSSLEQRTDIRRFFYERGWNDAEYQPPWNFDTHYVWGWSSPTEIPATLLHLARQSRQYPADWTEKKQVSATLKDDVKPLLGPMAGCLLLALIALRRRPLLLFALLGTALPYLVALRGATTMVDMHPRFLGNAFPPFPLFLGLSVAFLVQGALPEDAFGWSALLRAKQDKGRAADNDEPQRTTGFKRLTPSLLRPFLALVLLLSLLMGFIPSFFSPIAPWRTLVVINDEVRTVVGLALEGKMTEKPYCRYIIEKDAARGIQPTSQLFPDQ